MILPIGHAETATRRLPWVTFAIMAICLAALLGTDTSQLGVGTNPDVLFQEATDYWRDHAYLEAEPEIRTQVGYDVTPNQRSQYLALLQDQALATAPRDPAIWQGQQEELDRLTDYAFGRALSPAAMESESPFRRWGLLPSDIGVVTLITHIFMHAGWLHLLSNLFMLFLAGPAVEDRLGRPIFASFYLLAGVFAALFWAFLVPDRNIPLVGASGAIAGVLGAFLVRFWSSDIRFAYFFMFGFRPYFGTFEAKAWLMLPLWFANEIFHGYLAHSLGVSGGVAYWAHVGGFAFGAASVWVFRVSGIEEKFIDARIEEKVTLVAANPVVEEALEMRNEGNGPAALELLQEAFAKSPNDRDVALALWDTALWVDQPEAGVGAMKEVIRICVADGDASLAVGHWMDLTRVLPCTLIDPGTLIRLAGILVDEGDKELAVRALRHAVDPDNTPMTTSVALRTLDTARELDPPSALAAARSALESTDLVDTKRLKVQRVIDELIAAGVSEPPSVVVEEATREAAKADREIELPDEPGMEAMVVAPLVMGASPQAPLPPPIPPPVPPPLPGLDEQSPPPLEARALSLDGELVHEPGGDDDAMQEAMLSPPPLPLMDDDAGGFSDEPMLGADISEGLIDSIVEGPRFSGIKVVDARPTALQDDVLRMMVSDERKAKLEYEKIEAVAVAAVRGIGPKTVLVIDLVLNWTVLEETPLRVIRLRSCDFDPRSVVPEAADAMSALKGIVTRILEGSGAVALPSRQGASGDPFEVFEDLSSYEREVLQVEA
jgi:membrane associated rhomboid family serine protease